MKTLYGVSTYNGTDEFFDGWTFDKEEAISNAKWVSREQFEKYTKGEPEYRFKIVLADKKAQVIAIDIADADDFDDAEKLFEYINSYEYTNAHPGWEWGLNFEYIYWAIGYYNIYNKEIGYLGTEYTDYGAEAFIKECIECEYSDDEDFDCDAEIKDFKKYGYWYEYDEPIR